MILGQAHIEAAIRQNDLRVYRTIGGEAETQIIPEVGPNSIDVTLGDKLLVPRRATFPVIDPLNDDQSGMHLYREDTCIDGYTLHPGYSALGCTRERFEWADPAFPFITVYDGRSTLARLFLFSHVSSSISNFGFSGYWTLELHNASPWIIRLRPGMRIGQASFWQIAGAGIRDRTQRQFACEPVAPVLARENFA